MKTFENKPTELTDQDQKLGYANLALICLNSIPSEGLSPLEMANRIKVITPLTEMELNKSIELEDADYNVLLACAKSTRWRMIHPDIVAFNKYLGIE